MGVEPPVEIANPTSFNEWGVWKITFPVLPLRCNSNVSGAPTIVKGVPGLVVPIPTFPVVVIVPLLVKPENVLEAPPENPCVARTWPTTSNL